MRKEEWQCSRKQRHKTAQKAKTHLLDQTKRARLRARLPLFFMRRKMVNTPQTRPLFFDTVGEDTKSRTHNQREQKHRFDPFTPLQPAAK